MCSRNDSPDKMSNKKDDGNLWDGKNFTFIRFDTKVKAELLKKGGKSLLKHWDGSYSSAKLEIYIKRGSEHFITRV